MLKSNITLYPNKESRDGKVVDYDYYFNMIRMGVNKELVLAARELKEKEINAETKEDRDLWKDKYTALKNQSMQITPHGTIESGLSKANNNVVLNGVVCVDFDDDYSDEQILGLYNDKYTFAIHKSISGKGYCLFVKLKDPTKFDDAYQSLSKYFFDSYGAKADPSGKNRNRLRFVSYDDSIHINPSASSFTVKIEKKDILPRNLDFICNKDDFDNILSQIKDGYIDLCKEDYLRYVRIGMSIASEFGEAGRQYFHFICSYGGKYNQKHTDRDYNGFLANSEGKVSIGTFYYYCKEEGISIYSDKTKAIINRVSVSKSIGSKPTVESIVADLEVLSDIVIEESDKAFIQAVINSPRDLSKNADSGVKDIEILERFIIENYNPSLDVITQEKTVKSGVVMSDIEYNDIYVDASKKLDINVSKADVSVILNSSAVRKINILKDFFDRHDGYNPEGFIDGYIDCVYPNTDFNRWAFKKWMVGTMHNWLSSHNERLVSPLTLVLTGSRQGSGKSSFFRNIMPEELKPYFKEAKIDGKNNDSMYTMATSLMMLDDEFGGKAHKDVKEFKDTSDKNTITQRRPYEREPRTFKRRTSLCGTSNEDDILKDVTGNRRILPINVESTNYEKMISYDVTSMWVEAYRLLKNGFDWKIFSHEDVAYLDENTKGNQAENPMEDIFRKYISFESDPDRLHTTGVVMNQGEMLELVNQKVTTRLTKFDMKDILAKYKVKTKSHRLGGRVKMGVLVYVNYTDAPADLVKL